MSVLWPSPAAPERLPMQPNHVPLRFTCPPPGHHPQLCADAAMQHVLAVLAYPDNADKRERLRKDLAYLRQKAIYNAEGRPTNYPVPPHMREKHPERVTKRWANHVKRLLQCLAMGKLGALYIDDKSPWSSRLGREVLARVRASNDELSWLPSSQEGIDKLWARSRPVMHLAIAAHGVLTLNERYWLPGTRTLKTAEMVWRPGWAWVVVMQGENFLAELAAKCGDYLRDVPVVRMIPGFIVWHTPCRSADERAPPPFYIT